MNRLDDVKRPCEVRCFIMHRLSFDDREVDHVFAVVSWLKENHAIDTYVDPISVWFDDGYEDPDHCTFTPVQ